MRRARRVDHGFVMTRPGAAHEDASRGLQPPEPGQEAPGRARGRRGGGGVFACFFCFFLLVLAASCGGTVGGASVAGALGAGSETGSAVSAPTSGGAVFAVGARLSGGASSASVPVGVAAEESWARAGVAVEAQQPEAAVQASAPS